MKLSLDWIGDFVEFTDNSPQTIADKISVHTAEVDEVEQQGAALEKCCIGKVLTVEKHLNADKLSLCEVETDQGTKRVVCGGTNLREGMHVAFAHIGARVKWHGKEVMTLTKTKIRGETSEGMICAAEELGLESLFPECTGKSIIDLDGERKKLEVKHKNSVGMSLREFFNLTDTILHVDNHAITHRPDLFSHTGFARECIAIGMAKWKKEPLYNLPKLPKSKLPFTIHVEDSHTVPRYLGCTLHIENAPATPDWMKKRLEATGWRSHGLAIDITNYVTMEVGMPLHSFDLADIKGNIQIRGAAKGESIRTLDDIERPLPEGAIVMSDNHGIFDLLGIMGGLRSSTKESTTDIFLHAAVVDRKAIRRTILATGHRTDAATVYEKGIPHITAEQGFARALELFLVCAPKTKITSELHSWGENGTAPAIPLSPDRVHSLLGIEVPQKTIDSTLESLGCTVKKNTVSPPLWRPDLRTEPDLIEEIGRIVGYSTIPPQSPVAPCSLPKSDHRTRALRARLKECGYTELLPSSILGPKLLTQCKMDPKQAPELANAFGEDESLLQPSTLPQLLVHAQKYAPLSKRAYAVFTVGHVFTEKHAEHEECGLLFSSTVEGDVKEHALLQLKQHLLHTHKTLEILPSTDIPACAHSGQCADLTTGDTLLGHLFLVHPHITRTFDLPENTAAAYFHVNALLAEDTIQKTVKPLPVYPAITYDETVTRTHTDSVQKLLQNITKQSSLLQHIDITNLYEGKPLKKGQYNLTLRFTYRAEDRTLREEDVKKEHAKVMKLLS